MTGRRRSAVAGALARLQRAVAAGSTAVAAILLFALMMVTLVDVAGRYLFAWPLRGASEISGILLALQAYLALPAVCLARQHVAVGLLLDRLPDGARRRAGAATDLVGAAALGVVARELWAHGERLTAYRDVTAVLGVPTGPVAQLQAALCLAGAVVLAANAGSTAVAGAPAGG